MNQLNELEKRRMLKEAHRLLDNIEFNLHFMVNAIKAKKKQAA
jgi:hypothetical protein